MKTTKMIKVLSILLIGLFITSCEMSEQQKELEEARVSSFKVIDIETGDTIEVFISGNPGIACSAFKQKQR